jgi:hypothetical protein
MDEDVNKPLDSYLIMVIIHLNPLLGFQRLIV